MSEVNRYKKTSRTASRYKYLDRIESDGYEYIESQDVLEFKRSNKDSFFAVPLGYENRLDLVSYKFYGSALYWWVIAVASGIQDPFVVPVGTVLRIPPKSVALSW